MENNNKKFYRKYYFYNRYQNIVVREDQLVGKEMDDLDFFFADYKVQRIHTKECIFILKKSFLGMFKLRLHLHLTENKVHNYTIK